MHEVLDLILTQWRAQSWLEIIAVITAIIYLILAAKESIWCWLFAFISTAIYIYLFHEVSLISESLLNVFYLVMAVYGWLSWRSGERSDHHKPIVSWGLKKHVLIILITALCVPGLGMLTKQLGADFPYLDAFTTCFAVVTTFLLVYKVLENWYYWLVIDAVSVYLFWQKGLHLTAFLFGVYVILVFVCIHQWRQSYAQQ